MNKHILVVEDPEDNRQIIRDALGIGLRAGRSGKMRLKRSLP
jgi:hypothetical protein